MFARILHRTHDLASHTLVDQLIGQRRIKFRQVAGVLGTGKTLSRARLDEQVLAGQRDFSTIDRQHNIISTFGLARDVCAVGRLERGPNRRNLLAILFADAR